MQQVSLRGSQIPTRLETPEEIAQRETVARLDVPQHLAVNRFSPCIHVGQGRVPSPVALFLELSGPVHGLLRRVAVVLENRDEVVRNARFDVLLVGYDVVVSGVGV